MLVMADTPSGCVSITRDVQIVCEHTDRQLYSESGRLLERTIFKARSAVARAAAGRAIEESSEGLMEPDVIGDITPELRLTASVAIGFGRAVHRAQRSRLLEFDFGPDE